MTTSLAYFERDTEYQFDATDEVAYYHSILGYYGRGSCGSNPYYAAYNVYDFATSCELNGTGYDFDDGDPTGTFNNVQRDSRWTFETRLSGSTSRWDWTAGFFYQEADQHWVYGTYIDDLDRTEAWAAFETLYGPLAPTDIRWASSEQSKREDIAVFGETTLNLTEQWKLLLGARWYDTSIDRIYMQSTPGTAPVSVSTPSGSDDGWLPKVGFQYFFEDDRMFYALYSEGFRTGGINRARGNPTLPIQYESDLLKNWEAGIKTRWMGGKVQFNLIGYHQVWEDMQLELTDPSYAYGEPFQTVIANVGDANVDGVDLELDYVATDRLSLGLVATYLFEAEIADSIQVFDERDPDDLALDIPAGTRLPLVADLNLSAYAEYNWPVNWIGDGGNGWVRVQGSHTGDSYNRLLDNDGDPDGTGYGGRVNTPGYDIYDLRAGFTNASWEFTVYVDNFTDERAIAYHDTDADLFWGRDDYRILKPRTYGVSLRRYFK
jgi:outer membrane receptor protein involved in Fe transport